MSDLRLGTLDAGRFARLSAALDDALDLDATEREDFVADLSRHEPEIAAHLRELLASMAAARDEHLLETGVVLARGIGASMPDDSALVGLGFGPYRVLEVIGHGGMGMVWLAERADGLFERKVALKLVHPSLMGTALTERFAREREILASLDHPHIARLLDAGFTPEGQPYLALEFVNGIPLTAYCDGQHLSVRARVEILLQALHAVQFAHANLVIHRDLKPSNILVTGDGQVKLLDFGIAKLLTEGPARESELTALSGLAFTPEYASPEQITGAPIATTSDVYSLGVVLYELVCGQRPYRLKRESRGALEDAILAVDPPRPSDVAFTEAIATARSTAARKLAATLRGDLDTIALKALRKDPGARYASVEALAQDLERYLRGEAVLARPDQVYYRLSRFVARHKVIVASALATTMAMALGLASALWQAGVARDQATVARNEAARATAVQDFLLDLFRANSVEQPDPVKARQTTARELLDLGGRRVEESLKDAPEARASVLDTLADMYYQLGLYAEAARQRLRAVAAWKQAYGPNDPHVAGALLSYASDIADLPERAQVLPVLDEVRQILDATPDDASESRGRLLMMLAQANRYTAIDRMRIYADEAAAYFRQHPSQSGQTSLALTYAANARMQQGDAEAAEAVFHEALAEVARMDEAVSAWAVFPLIGLAEVQDTLGKVADSEQSYQSALAAAQARFGEFHPETLLVEAKLGAYLHATARREDGTRWMETARAGIGRGKGGYTPPYVIAVLSGLRARTLLAEGRLGEAAPLIAVDVDDARENYPGSAPLAGALRNQIALDTARGDYDEAGAKIDEALRITEGIGGAVAMRNRLLLDRGRLLVARGKAAAAIDALRSITPPIYGTRLPLRVQEVSVKTLLAEALLQQGQVPAAVAHAQDAHDQVATSPLRRYHPLLESDAALQLGKALRAAGEPQKARPYLERALEVRTALDAPASPWRGEAATALAACLADLRELKEAMTLAQSARIAFAANAPLGRHFTSPLTELERRLSVR
jgi:eukaryotic-like serine/threonine-protein kinase